MYCSATAVLKLYSVYKQGKYFHPQVFVEECKHTDAESQQCNSRKGGMNNYIVYSTCSNLRRQIIVT